MKTCPFCAEPIQEAAIVCKHCARDLPEHPAEQRKAKRAAQARQTGRLQLILVVSVVGFLFVGLPFLWSMNDNAPGSPLIDRPAQPTACRDGRLGQSSFTCTTGPDGTVFQFTPPLPGNDASVMAAMRTVLSSGMDVKLDNATSRETAAGIRFIAGAGVYDVMPIKDESGRFVGLVVTRPR